MRPASFLVTELVREYGIVKCNSTSTDFPKDCGDGFQALHSANGTAPIVASFEANASAENFNVLAADAVALLNEAEWAGVYVSMFFDPGSESSANLEAVVTFVKTMLSDLSQPVAGGLTVGIALANVTECMPGGDLYSSDPSQTLYTLLSYGLPEGVSLVLVFETTPPVAVSELCGFGSSRLGYELAVVRSFGGACSFVNLNYELVALPPATQPTNFRSGGGAGGEA